MVHVEDIMTKLGGPYEFRDNPIKDQDFESQDWRLATLSKDLWRKVDLHSTKMSRTYLQCIAWNHLTTRLVRELKRELRHY